MNDQSKRGIAAVMVAGCCLASVVLIVIGRLAPATFAASQWIAILGIIVSVLAVAIHTLRTYKSQ